MKFRTDFSNTSEAKVAYAVDGVPVGPRVDCTGPVCRRIKGEVSLSFSLPRGQAVLILSPLVAARLGAQLVQKGLYQ